MGGELGARIREGRTYDALAAVPGELRELEQWVVYRLESRNGAKATKTPYQPARPRRRASSTDPSTWGTFEQAIAAQVRAGAAGVGFVFAEADPFVGLDLDACLRDGTLHPGAYDLVARLNSYTEVSPSGTGLHVIGRGELGAGRRTSDTPWGGELEVYDRGRYFTITGHRFEHSGNLGDVAVTGILAGLMPDEPEPAPAAARPLATVVHLDDRDVLERAFAARNGAKFRALWQGDTSAYGSSSEADCALCAMLAFWVGPDEARIDWLFRQSGLVRPKWEEREDYRADTIARALRGRTEFYEPRAAARLPAVTTTETALEVATAAIAMGEVPLVGAREALDGRVVLERADGLKMAAPSLESLATFAKLAGAVVAGFGHELVVEQNKKTATAHRFVAALRRHLGPAQVEAREQMVEGWLVDLARLAGEVTFETGAGESRLRAWRALDELDPELERGAHAFAKKVALAHELHTGDRYLQAGWAQEYLRRRGWRGSTEGAVAMFGAIGLERPSADGRVRAHWRAGGETIVLRFWVIPRARFEQWQVQA